jgi:hypothetical protein
LYGPSRFYRREGNSFQVMLHKAFIAEGYFFDLRIWINLDASGKVNGIRFNAYYS